MSYFNGHCHTSYSNALLGFPDSTVKLNELIQYAYDSGLSGIAITEHEGISSHIQAINYYESMEKTRPFTLALGNEIYLLDEDEDLANRNDSETKYPYYHFILIALDTEGHKQIRELSTRAWIRGYKKSIWRRPTYTTDLEDIVEPNKGHLIALSACLGSRVDRYLMQGRNADVDDFISHMNRIFGKGNFYLECQPAVEQGTEQDIVNHLLLETAKRNNIRLVCTTDVHYLKKDDKDVHTAFLLSQEGDREIGSFYDSTYLMTEEELRNYLKISFEDNIVDKIIKWSAEIGDRVQGYNLKHKPIIPQIPEEKIPPFKIKHTFKDWYEKYPYFGYYSNRPEIHEQYFFYQAECGLQEKVVDRGLDLETYIDRLNTEWRELKIISDDLDSPMAVYYSTMSKNIELIWEAGSLSMPSRGSAMGYLTCYLLSVTQINPVPLGSEAPFWRHLSHERGVELPD